MGPFPEPRGSSRPERSRVPLRERQQRARGMKAKQREELLRKLKARFEKNINRHPGLDWAKVQARLEANTEKLSSLNEMEGTGGEPDVVGHDKETGEYTFYDCSAESPIGRRSLCYDREALESRKEHQPENNAVDTAAAMGIELLTEEQYRGLQKLGKFDTKTSSWVKTPAQDQETRRRPLLRSPLRHCLSLSQRRALVLCRQGVPGLAQGLGAAPRRGDRRRCRRHHGCDLRGRRRRRDPVARAHARRGTQDPHQRRRPLQHPARAGGRAAVRHRLVTPHSQKHPSLVAARGADRVLRARAGPDAGRGARDGQAVSGVEPRARRAGWIAGAGGPPRRALSAGDHGHRARARGGRLAGRAGARGTAGSGRGGRRDRRAVGAEHRERRPRAGDTRGAGAHGAPDVRGAHAGGREPGTVRARSPASRCR